MIAVTFALPAESGDFLRLLSEKTRGRDGVIAGKLHHKQVLVLHTGVGQEKAQSRTARFVQHHKVALLICSGFAGAIGDSLGVGDLLLAENFSSSDRIAPAKAALQELPLTTGRLATAHSVIDSAAERAAFAELHRAVAVDMETEFLAEICGSIHLPMLALRAISDSPAAPFPAPPRVLFDIARQRTVVSRLLLHLAQNPAAVPHLLAFAKQVAFARRSLTTALDLLLRHDLA